MKKIYLIMILLISAVAVNFAKDIEKGDKATQIEVIQWLNAPPKAGKPVLLEFWATWCGPCRKAIPHLNEIVEKYGNDLSIISLSIEKADVITPFMKNTEMKASVGIDFDRKTSTAYQVKYIPHAFLINLDGTIEWVGSPFELDSQKIELFLAKNKTMKPGAPLFKTIDPKDLKFSLKLEKTKKPTEQGSLSDSPEGILFSSMLASTILEFLLNASPLRIDAPADLKEEKYDLLYRHEMIMPFQEFRSVMLNRVCDAFKVKIEKSTETMKVYKLRCVNCDKLKKEFQLLSEKTNSYQSKFEEKDGKMNATTVNISSLIRYLESMHKKIFVDETGLPGFYDFVVSQANIEAAISDLEKSGLKVVYEDDQIETYKIIKK